MQVLNLAQDVQFSIDVKNVGDQFQKCFAYKTATAQYTGRLVDGTQFDSGTFSFMVGAGKVIKCWDVAFEQMNVQEVATVTCPSWMAYGDKQVGPIPPNSTLIFDIHVLQC